jgi:hypothetical protein
MKANVQYNDFQGTVSADISDALGGIGTDDLERIGRYFKLDEERFKIVGLSIYGVDGFSVSLICVDKDQSNDQHEHIVKMSIDIEDDTEILKILFKRLHILLHDRHDEKYPNLEIAEEVNFNDFHETED